MRSWLFLPAGTVDHQASASMQTPSDMYIVDLFYAKLHDQNQEQPAICEKEGTIRERVITVYQTGALQ